MHTPDLDDVFLALTGDRPMTHAHDLRRSADSATMLRRNLRRMVRYPVDDAPTVGIPLIFLLLFVFVFGDTLGAGLAGAGGGRGDYLDYVTPGIIAVGRRPAPRRARRSRSPWT